MKLPKVRNIKNETIGMWRQNKYKIKSNLIELTFGMENVKFRSTFNPKLSDCRLHQTYVKDIAFYLIIQFYSIWVY